MCQMSFGRTMLRILACAALLGGASQVRAGNLTLDGNLDSVARVLVKSSTGAQDTDNKVLTNPPDTKTATKTLNEVSSTATVTLTDTSFGLSLLQTDTGLSALNQVVAPLTVPSGSLAAGSGSLFFRVATNTTFSLSGSYVTTILDTMKTKVKGTLLQLQPANSTAGDAELQANLMDFTTSTTIFSQDKTGSIGGTLTLDPQTGTLIAGHLYGFDASSSISVSAVQAGLNAVDPQGTGTITFNFTPVVSTGGVPLPIGASSGLAALGVLAGVELLRRRRVTA